MPQLKQGRSKEKGLEAESLVPMLYSKHCSFCLFVFVSHTSNDFQGLLLPCTPERLEGYMEYQNETQIGILWSKCPVYLLNSLNGPKAFVLYGCHLNALNTFSSINMGHVLFLALPPATLHAFQCLLSYISIVEIRIMYHQLWNHSFQSLVPNALGRWKLTLASLQSQHTHTQIPPLHTHI